MKCSHIKKWSSERLSQCVFYVLLAISAIIFALFYLVGFETPSLDVPTFNEPLFTEGLLGWMSLLLLLSLTTVVVVLWRGYKTSERGEKCQGVPGRQLQWCTWGGTVILLILTFVLASAAPMKINGRSYTDWLWLKITDMLIWTSSILLLIAVAAVVFGATRYIRKGHRL